MYYPYLRGRQFELLALRNFCDYLTGECNIIPVIEPVKELKNTLVKAADAMSKRNMRFAVVLNPAVGECAKQYLRFDNEEILSDKNKWIPAFIVESGNIERIKQEISANGYTRVMLVISKKEALDEIALLELVSNNEISTVLVDPQRRTTVRNLKSAKVRNIIEFEDKFMPKFSGKDYIGIDEEAFSQEFFYYKDDGYTGFSDYTILPSAFKEGGTIPKVLVMHLSYQKDEENIYIKHFVSDSLQDDKADIQRKFFEAANKAIAFFNQINDADAAINMLQTYIQSGSYPGLGQLKKISILHHLLLMQKILSERGE